MDILLTIIFVIVLGIICILLEILVFPGITVAGTLGVILVVAGIYLSYTRLGSFEGNIMLFATLVFGLISTYFAFRAKTWKAATLDKSIEGKFEVFKKADFKKGDKGITVSRLAPMGNIKIKKKIIEATTRGEFIDEKQVVVVIKVMNNLLVVESKKKS